METIYREKVRTAPTSRTQVDALASMARLLWSSELQFCSSERENLVVELIAIETDIQRLTVRSIDGMTPPPDQAEIDECVERLRRLDDQWRGNPDKLLAA